MNLMMLFHPISADIRACIDAIPPVIDRIFPLPGQFRRKLPDNILALSQLLTNNKGSRTVSYLGKPALLSAYLRYFLPWNIYRLCRLLPSLSLCLKPDDMIADLGSGPLTFVIALWIAKPELREMPLEFRCIDHTQTVLDAGKKLFFTLAGEGGTWTIKTIKGDINTPIYGKRPAIVTAVNVFNETYQKLPYTVSLQTEADNIGKRLAVLAPEALVVEPGVPRSGEFISLLRHVLIRSGFVSMSPCPHPGLCPLVTDHTAVFNSAHSRAKSKWCHFAFDTIDAPEALLKLSADAGLPKERVTVSFLFAQSGLDGRVSCAITGKGSGADSPHIKAGLPVRVLSDCFPLPPPMPEQKTFAGRYGCSEKGLVLIQGGKKAIERLSAGTLIQLSFPKSEQRDKKSKALLVDFTGE